MTSEFPFHQHLTSRNMSVLADDLGAVFENLHKEFQTLLQQRNMAVEFVRRVTLLEVPRGGKSAVAVEAEKLLNQIKEMK